LLEKHEELVQDLFLTFRDHLDGMIRAVADIALKAQTASDLPGIEAIADALYLAVDSCF
jgi:hypothetical protein